MGPDSLSANHSHEQWRLRRKRDRYRFTGTTDPCDPEYPIDSSRQVIDSYRDL